MLEEKLNIREYNLYIALTLIFINLYLFICFDVLKLIDMFIYSLILLMAVIDARYYLVPKTLSKILFFISFIGTEESEYIYKFLIVLIIFVVSLKLKYVGLGDVKTLLSLFMYLPFNKFVLIFKVSIYLGGLYSIVRLAFNSLTNREKINKIAFIPFIFLAYSLLLWRDYYDM